MPLHRKPGDIINRTPHEVRLLDENGETVLVIPPSGEVKDDKGRIVGYLQLDTFGFGES